MARIQRPSRERAGSARPAAPRPAERPARTPRTLRERPEREKPTREKSTREKVQRTERIPVAMPQDSRAAAWMRNFRLSGFALSVLLLVVAALIVLAPSLKTFFEQRQQIAALEESVRLAQEDVDGLHAEIDRWSDPAYIESQARDRLYYVYPGDITFLVIGHEDGGLQEEGLPISDEIQTTQVDWVRALLSTVYEAGLTDAEPSQIPSPGD